MRTTQRCERAPNRPQPFPHPPPLTGGPPPVRQHAQLLSDGEVASPSEQDESTAAEQTHARSRPNDPLTYHTVKLLQRPRPVAAGTDRPSRGCEPRARVKRPQPQRVAALSPMRSRNARRRESGSDSADCGSRTLEIGRRRQRVAAGCRLAPDERFLGERSCRRAPRPDATGPVGPDAWNHAIASAQFSSRSRSLKP